MKDTAELFASLDALKARLDAHRPLPADIVSQIRQDMRIRFTYHSNAIEGNTLTMSETKAVLEDGITIGGKSLREHLEAVGHSQAIDYLEVLAQGDAALTERTLKDFHSLILRNIDGICGFDAQYDCPVAVTLYVDPSAAIPEKMLRDSIEVKEAHMLAHGGKVRAIPVHYELKSYDPAAGRIGRREFLDLMFEQTRDLSAPFKHNTETYGDDAKYPKGVYEVECRGIEKPLIKRSFPYFRGFLSLKEGITRLDVALNDEEVPVLRIVYVKSMWDDAKIWNELLNAKVWPVKYKDGTLKDEEPKFTFKTEGHTL